MLAPVLGLLVLAASDLTCDASALARDSVRLTTEAQALNVTADRSTWWDGFRLGKHEADLGDLNDTATFLAERALEIDTRNLMGHAILARQFLIAEQAEAAEAAWGRVLDAGGAVVWSATLYDVNARTYFVVAVDRSALRVYRFGQLAGEYKRAFGGVPEFPGPQNTGFWTALGGCLPATVVPEATIPWSDVREIKAGNWVLWFKLAKKVVVADDGGKRKTLDELKVNLHGRTGTIEVYKPVGGNQLGTRGRGPWTYQDTVRRTIVKFVDPERRIALPASSPGVGW
jgi:hypothetical protein